MATQQLQLRIITAAPLIFVLLWSTGFIGAKYALPYIEPYNLLYIRMVITSIAFLGLIWLLKARWPNKKEAAHSAASGLLIHGLYLGGVFTAIKWEMPAGLTAIIVGLQPITTTVIARYFLGTKLSARQVVGLALGLVGIGIIIASTQRIEFGGVSARGIIACVASLFGISIGTLYQKRYCANINLLTGSFWQYSTTALFMFILSTTFEVGVIDWTPQLVFSLGWLVFGLSIGAILLLMYLIREGEASKVATYFYLVPATVCIESYFLFGEKLPAVAILAMMITIFGVYLVVSSQTHSNNGRHISDK